MSFALLGSKVGHQVVSLTLPHCLGMSYWLYQLVLSLYLHQPESHQLSQQKVLDGHPDPKIGPQGHLGPIKMRVIISSGNRWASTP